MDLLESFPKLKLKIYLNIYIPIRSKIKNGIGRRLVILSKS
jgi:hypothetical protein